MKVLGGERPALGCKSPRGQKTWAKGPRGPKVQGGQRSKGAKGPRGPKVQGGKTPALGCKCPRG